MSNSTNQRRSGSRARLLATASSIAIIMSAGASDLAYAENSRPTLWLEEGVTLDNIGESVNSVDLPLGPAVSPSGLTGPLSDSLNFGHAGTGEGKITFQPEDSDWVFSASVRYGRAIGKRSHINQALAPIPTTSFTSYKFTYPYYAAYNKTRVKKAPQTGENIREEFAQRRNALDRRFRCGQGRRIGSVWPRRHFGPQRRCAVCKFLHVAVGESSGGEWNTFRVLPFYDNLLSRLRNRPPRIVAATVGKRQYDAKFSRPWPLDQMGGVDQAMEWPGRQWHFAGLGCKRRTSVWKAEKEDTTSILGLRSMRWS